MSTTRPSARRSASSCPRSSTRSARRCRRSPPRWPDGTRRGMTQESEQHVSRRRLLAGLGALGAAGVAAGGFAGGYAAADTRTDATTPALDSQIVPFRAAHQGGIVTEQQDRMLFATFNVTSGTGAAELREMLRDWTAAADAMTRGQLVPGQ